MTDVFSHVGITCKDPDLIENFYVKHFGFKRTRVFSSGDSQIVMIKSGSFYLELFKSTEESPIGAAKGTGQEYPGWRHICFSVANIDAKLKEMGEAARITLGPLQLDDFVKGMKACWIADPEGNIIELCQGYADEER